MQSKPIWVLSLAAILSPLVLPAVTSAEDQPPSPSRAAWWLAQDEVAPIADLVNKAAPGKGVDFTDRVGDFTVKAEDRALLIEGSFPQANIWRFDLSTSDGQFDMRKTYVVWGNCGFPDPNSIWSSHFTQLLGDPEKGLTHTGPWEVFNGKWVVPTARVALDGEHIYTSWFDLPSLADQKAGRVYASFGLEILKPGKHTVRVAFDDFQHHTRWRPGHRGKKEPPPVEYSRNDLRPHHIGSIAIGIDERVRMLEDIKLKPELVGKHPRLRYDRQPSAPKKENLTIADIKSQLVYVDPDRGALWEYSDDAESMASGNDMDAGRKAFGAAAQYDTHVNALSPEAKKEWDRLFIKRMGGLYRFFVFQRNYHPTGYSQNHSSATVIGLVGAGLAFDGPEAKKWLNWGALTCRKRVEILGKDGGLEYMNESRSYGLGFSQKSFSQISHCTTTDVTAGQPFFENEWRYALHQAHMFPTDESRKPWHPKVDRRRGHNPNVPLPASVTPENAPPNWHFDDVDQVFVRSHWGEDAYRARLWAGTVFGKEGARKAKRYNWAHCRVNQGSFVLSKGKSDLILEAGRTRTYRKSAGNNNCILINDTDQCAGGQVWHPKLEPHQISRIAFYADASLMCAARADLKNAYPPEAKLKALSRCLIHLKPDHFLVFDRVETDGKGKAEWRFHTAYSEPAAPSDRFTVFGYTTYRPKRGEQIEKTYENLIKKRDDVQCEVAFLTPRIKATLAMSDPYFRYGPFARPPRHLKVVQEGEEPMALLSVFSPKIALDGAGNSFTGKSGDVLWTVLVGEGAANGLESDAHLAVSALNEKSKEAQVMRFGGSKLVFQATTIKSGAEDAFARISGGKIVELLETKPGD